MSINIIELIFLKPLLIAKATKAKLIISKPIISFKKAFIGKERAIIKTVIKIAVIFRSNLFIV